MGTSFCSTRTTSTAGAGFCTLSAALVPEQPDTARMIAIRVPALIVRLIASSFDLDVKCNAFANAKSLNLVRNALPVAVKSRKASRNCEGIREEHGVRNEDGEELIAERSFMSSFGLAAGRLGNDRRVGSGRVNIGSRIRRRVVRGELLCRGSARSV